MGDFLLPSICDSQSGQYSSILVFLLMVWQFVVPLDVLGIVTTHKGHQSVTFQVGESWNNHEIIYPAW